MATEIVYCRITDDHYANYECFFAFRSVFLSLFKDAIIRPLLKKSNLDVDQLKRYRPVSNTHFLSKILKKLVIGRLEDRRLENLLYDPF